MKNIKDNDSMNPLYAAGIRSGLVLIFYILSSIPFGNHFGGGSLFAQQLPFSSQYYSNPLVINPAFTGISENINVFLTNRSQWTGLPGAPQTSYFTIDGPIQAKNSSLGLKIYSDVTDIISRAGAFVSYSYKFKISDSNNLYFGAACGIFNNKIDFSKASIPDIDDPFLSQQLQNKTVFSLDLGIVYVWKKLEIGFAVPQVLGNSIKYPILNGDNSYYNLDRHYQGSVKYVFVLSKEKGMTAYPLVMFRTVSGAPFQYDVNAVADWKRIGWVGITYHSNYAVALSGGVRYRNFCAGYAYDIGISKVRSYTGSSSEFLLGYNFGRNKKEKNRFVKVEEPRIDITALGRNTNSDTNKVSYSQLKANAAANQAQLDRAKEASETDKAEINRLKAELAKAKEPLITAPSNSRRDDSINQVLLAQSKAASEADKAEINRLKAELAKAKEPIITAPSNAGRGDSINQALLARSKALSDSYLAENNRLKAELEKAKATLVANPSKNEIIDSKSAAFISIRLVDEKGNPLTDAQIEVIDKANEKVIARPLVNNDGYSRISLPPGKTVDIVVTKSGFLFKTFNVVVPESAGDEKKLEDITLQKAEVGKKLVLKNIFFDVNEAKLKKEAFLDLKNAVKLMKDMPKLEIEISGHGDNVGSAQYNLQLSKRRAKAVMDYLISNGCDKNRLTYVGYGSTMPIASNDTKEGRQINRRTEFKILKVDSEHSIAPEKKSSKVENLPNPLKSGKNSKSGSKKFKKRVHPKDLKGKTPKKAVINKKNTVPNLQKKK